MDERSDIMARSRAWQKLQDRGVPPNITPLELREILHAYPNVLTTIVAKIDETRDDLTVQEARNADTLTKLGELERRIFDGETGLVAKLSKRYITLLTSVLVLVLSVAFAIAKDVVMK